MKTTSVVWIASLLLSAATYLPLHFAFVAPEVHKKPPVFTASQAPCPKSAILCARAHTHENAEFTNAEFTGERVRFAHFPSASNIAQERFQAGPVSVEIQLMADTSEGSEDSILPVSFIGVDTSVSASLEPVSLRVFVTLHLRDSRAESTHEAALEQKQRPSRSGRPLQLLISE